MASRISPLPIIDLTPFDPSAPSTPESQALKSSVAEQLAAACVMHGAFYIKSGSIGGLTRDMRKQVFDAAGHIFSLPDPIKKSIPIKPGGFTRGYIGIGGESGSDALEVKEAFSYGYPWPADKTPGNELQGPNVWPADCPETVQTTLTEFYTGMCTVAGAVTRALSLALGMDEHHLEQYCTKGDTISLMRLFHYFPYSKADSTSPSTTSRIGSSPHTDWGFLTLIMQQDGPSGLQLLDPSNPGTWLDVPPIPGTFIVNAGDYLSLLTSGQVMSPIHRVVTSPTAERTSCVFFWYPDYEAQIPEMDSTGAVARISLLMDQSLPDSKPNLAQPETTQKVTQPVHDVQFGKYIAQKWDQVFRGPK
ncbi:hypothetical protein DFS34DRAFT_93066 [Phlyctochytrium arcticum]|nr:hypothetical protein DFS34DRAFT_93066 [Phlyctochytrium arcticum]